MSSNFLRVAFFVLAAVVIWRGVLPALSQIPSDFPNYYAASRLLITGRIDHRIYDNAWFGSMAESMGLSRDSRFIPFPPPTIFLLLPVAWLDPLNALRLWTVANVLLTAYSIRLLAMLSKRAWQWCGIIVLLSGRAIINNFRFGQAYIALMTTMMLFVLYLERRKQAKSAIWLGAGIALKYFPAVYVPLLAARKQWRVIIGAAMVVLLLWISAAAFLGWGTVADFLARVAASHVQGDIVGQSNNAVLFQSWNSLLRRLFVFDPLTNPAPVLNVRSGYKWGLTVVYCAWLFTAGLGWKSLLRYDPAWRFKQEAAYVTVAAFVILPASATYHVLLLAPALVLHLAPWKTYNRFEWAALIAYCGIGMVPYSWTSGFAARGWLVLFAYPRLWLITVMFGAMTLALRSRAIKSPAGDGTI
jgi:hypothetical protein